MIFSKHYERIKLNKGYKFNEDNVTYKDIKVLYLKEVEIIPEDYTLMEGDSNTEIVIHKDLPQGTKVLIRRNNFDLELYVDREDEDD